VHPQGLIFPKFYAEIIHFQRTVKQHLSKVLSQILWHIPLKASRMKTSSEISTA